MFKCTLTTTNIDCKIQLTHAPGPPLERHGCDYSRRRKMYFLGQNGHFCSKVIEGSENYFLDILKVQPRWKRPQKSKIVRHSKIWGRFSMATLVYIKFRRSAMKRISNEDCQQKKHKHIWLQLKSIIDCHTRAMIFVRFPFSKALWP